METTIRTDGLPGSADLTHAQEEARAARERARELLRELTQLLESLGAAGYEASVNGYQVTVEREQARAVPSELEQRERTAAQWYALIREQ